MTLLEMRTLLLANLGDDAQDLATNAKSSAWLNAALASVCNWADAQDQMLFSNRAVCADTGTANSSGYLTVRFNASDAAPNWGIVFGPFRRLLGIMQEPVGGNSVPLQIVEFEKRDAYKGSAMTDTPACCVLSDGILLIRPNSNLNLTMHYIQSVPPMVADTDTPGLTNGSGRSNLLPIEYHPLVVAQATAMAYSSEGNRTAELWLNIYDDLKTNLGATLAKRRGARVDKA